MAWVRCSKSWLFLAWSGVTFPVFGMVSPDSVYVDSQITEAQDRLLVAEESQDDALLALNTEQFRLNRILKHPEAFSSKKIKQSRLAVQTAQKTIEERKLNAQTAQIQLRIWRLHKENSPLLQDAYRELWKTKALQFRVAREAAQPALEHEREIYAELQILAEKGTIPEKHALESRHRIVEAEHQIHLFQKREQNASGFDLAVP